jgi:3'(2'), 5'-bisphosphate nucleotidase
MPPVSIDQIQKIHWLLRDCGQQAKQMAAESFQVFEKGRDDYVTSVDRALDDRLTSGFKALFPQAGIITEENVSSRSAFQSSYRHLWCIDPIDGTDDFIQGKQHYAVMVGLLEANQPTAGWIYAPAFDELYYGGWDWGLFQARGDRPAVPLIPTEPAPLSAQHCPILIGYKDRHRYGEAINHCIPEAQFSSVGSFGLKVMEVILGRAGLYIYLNGRVKLWDTTGPLALARAAGLICCDLAGNALQFTPDAVDVETLAHDQTIVIGWASYIMGLRSRLRQAVLQVQQTP